MTDLIGNLKSSPAHLQRSLREAGEAVAIALSSGDMGKASLALGNALIVAEGVLHDCGIPQSPVDSLVRAAAVLMDAGADSACKGLVLRSSDIVDQGCTAMRVAVYGLMSVLGVRQQDCVSLAMSHVTEDIE